MPDIIDKDTNQRETFCFIAARLPEELDDEIKKVQGQFMKAQNQLTDDEIIESLPKVYPCDKYSIDKARLPGVGRFPVDQWIRDGQPSLDGPGWIALAMKIAEKDYDALSGIFDLGKTLEEEEIEAECQMASGSSL